MSLSDKILDWEYDLGQDAVIPFKDGKALSCVELVIPMTDVKEAVKELRYVVIEIDPQNITKIKNKIDEIFGEKLI